MIDRLEQNPGATLAIACTPLPIKAGAV